MKCEDAQGNQPAPAEYKLLMEYFLDQQKPMNFNPYDQDNILQQREVGFMDMLNSMEDAGAFQPKKMTEFEFYSKVRYFEKKHKS